MSLSIGDAVLTFLGDTTQLQQVFAQVPAQAEASMAKAAASVQTLNFALDATGENVAFAGSKFPQLASNWDLTGEAAKAAGVNALAFGAEAAEGVEVANHAAKEAKGTLGLLGEAFGIHLPRHVRGFVVELPGVATALSAAFSAVAIYFVIEALIKGIEKIQEFAHHAEKITEAWEAVDKVQHETLESLENDLIRSEIKVDELTNKHLEAMRLKLQLIDNLSLAKLQSELEKIGAAADKAFEEANKFGGIERFFGIENVTPVLKTKFDDIGKAAQEALSVRTPEAYAEGLKKVQAALDEANSKVNALREQQAKFDAESKAHPLMGTLGSGVKPVDPGTLQTWEELRKRVEGYKKAIEDSQQTEKNDKQVERLQNAKRVASELEAIEKDRQKGLDHRQKVEADYAKAQEKQHDKVIKDAEREKEELNAANISIANVQLAQFHRMAEGARAWIDGEMDQVEAATQKKAAIFKFQYDTALISGQKYLDEIKKLYNAEAQALINLLNQKQQLVILEAQKEAAARGQIMTVAEAKELKGFIDLENQKKAVIDKSLTAIDKQVQTITTHAAKARPTWDKFFDDIIKGSTKSGAALKTLGALTAQAIGESVAAAVMGSQSFGEAMTQMLKSVLAMLAGKAVVKALEELAEAFSALANPFTAWMAPGHFKAAAMWGVVAGAAGAAGAALGGGGGGGAGGGEHPQIDKENPNNQPAKNPPPGDKNVPHLAGGGLITETTRAMIHSGEAVIPLTDSNVMDAIGAAFARHSEGARGGDTFYFQTKGLISADTWSKTAKKLSRQVKTGRARLVASDSHKTTRRA